MKLTRRRMLVLSAAGVSASAMAAAGESDGESSLAGGTMALTEAYKKGEGLWVGPDSAKANVDPGPGDLYLANDTQLDYIWDGDSWNVQGVGSEGNPVQGVHSESVSTDYLPGVEEIVEPGDDVQARLDSYDKRDTTVVFARAGQNYSFSSPITVGQLTHLRGAGAVNKTAYNNETFDTPIVLDFSSAEQHGIQTDADASYSPQRMKFEDISLIGAGDYIGEHAGIWAEPTNGNTSYTDLWGLEGVWIGNFKYGIHGRGATDSWFIRECEIHSCPFGMKAMYGGSKIEDVVIWGTKELGAEFVGSGNEMSGCEIQPDYNVPGVVFKADENSIHDSDFQLQADPCVKLDGSAGTIYGNMVNNNSIRGTFGNFVYGTAAGGSEIRGNTSKATHSKVPIDLGGGSNYNTIAFNNFRSADLSSAGYFIRVDGSGNRILWNTTANTGPPTDIRIAGGADNIVYGYYPGGVSDAGTRTIINGKSTNAGNPSAGGQWNGHARRAYEMGVRVYDTNSSPYLEYYAVPDGSGGYTWQQNSSTAA